ncbi:MAG: protein phosphatase 2C domain-containing protein [Gemmatimonadaceae bacterium]
MPEAESQPIGEIDASGLSHTGLVSAENQDRFVIAALQKSVQLRQSNLESDGIGNRFRSPEALFLAVADGVGGRAGGAHASNTAVKTLLEFIIRAGGCYQRFDVAEEDAFIGQMEAGIREAHESILEEFGSPNYAPATTLTMVMIVAPRAYVVHVGDTRAYYLRRGRLLQLTKDQTMGQYMLDAGAWTEEQVQRSANAKVLASAIGSSEVTPSIGLVDLDPGDVVLVCSDGLTKHVTHEEIAAILGDAASAEAACATLVERALAGGGTDNITVVVARTT